jgi:hypothetical protein
MEGLQSHLGAWLADGLCGHGPDRLSGRDQDLAVLLPKQLEEQVHLSLSHVRDIIHHSLRFQFELQRTDITRNLLEELLHLSPELVSHQIRLDYVNLPRLYHLLFYDLPTLHSPFHQFVIRMHTLGVL